MPGPKIAYQHFCPAARALEVIGEKWSLLIVRDLLGGARRFNDLRRSLAAITPKWLSLRLHELEQFGIVQREATGQREVWYRLTPKGQALAPVIEDLVVWGMDYALQPPRVDETINLSRAFVGLVTYLNRSRASLPHAAVWVVRFPDGVSYTVRFDGERWSRQRGELPADVIVETAPEDWVRFLAGDLDQRRIWLAEHHAEGTAARIEELARTIRRSEPVALSA